MRSAAIDTHWRALRKSPRRAVELRRFSFQGLAGTIDDAITFESPMTALCGLSGAGKSTLLRAIWATLDWATASKRIEVRNRLAGAILQARIEVDDVESSITCSVDTETVVAEHSSPLEVLHFDPSFVAASLQAKFGALQGLDGLLDAYEPIEFTHEEVETISYISKKDYKSIRIFEIDEFEEDEPLPFVKIDDGHFEYDTRTMSLDEISILLCFWTLRRAERGAFLLAEEPETFISPSSQAALMNYLVSVCVTKNMFMILTTHSPQMVACLDEEQVRFFFSTPSGSQAALPSQYDRMRRIVGLEMPIDIFVPVEDRAAREFAKLLLARVDHPLSLRTDFLDVGGHSIITQLRQLVPQRSRSMVVVGVYDGDMKGDIAAVDGEWPLVFLPGSQALERIFQDLAEAHTQMFAEKLGRSKQDLEVALTALRGGDHHDWLEDLASELGLSYEQMMMGAFESWYSLDTNKEAAIQFVNELRAVAKRG